MFGCIDEDTFSLQSPRILAGDECETLAGAFEQALEMIIDGTKEVAICKAQYYGDDGNGYWGEIVDGGTIQVDASQVAWAEMEI